MRLTQRVNSGAGALDHAGYWKLLTLGFKTQNIASGCQFQHSVIPAVSPGRQETAAEDNQHARRLTIVFAQYFRFGSRIIDATGAQSDWEHPNVLRLTIHGSTLDRVVRTLLYPFPSALRSWVQSTFPEWMLPTNIVLKKQKDDWEDEFNTEEATYERLRSLQGHVIPICYGQIEYDGARALILSDVGGACLAEPEGAMLNEKELRPLLNRALSALASCCISHDDIKLDNFHLVGQDHARIIMVVDLEREELEWMVKKNTNSLIKAYRDHLDCLREDGLKLLQEGVLDKGASNLSRTLCRLNEGPSPNFIFAICSILALLGRLWLYVYHIASWRFDRYQIQQNQFLYCTETPERSVEFTLVPRTRSWIF
ncbi:hypothetical protein HRG_013787 [Hirsutella rhossiliensis]